MSLPYSPLRQHIITLAARSRDSPPNLPPVFTDFYIAVSPVTLGIRLVELVATDPVVDDDEAHRLAGSAYVLELGNTMDAVARDSRSG